MTYAQFSENFDTSTTLPTGWSVINNGDTNTWTISAPGTGTANSGTNVARIYRSTAAHDDYLITPQFTVTTGVSDYLTLWGKNRSATSAEYFDILLSITDNTATAFTTTIATAVTPTTSWGKFTYDLSAYNGQTVYIAFHSTTTNLRQLYLDNISVGKMPTCIEPTALGTSNATTTGATLSWTASTSNPANGYDYYYSTINTAPDNTTTPNGNVPGTASSVDLTGLTPNTVYYCWIRSNCSSTDSSIWIGGTFTTLAIPPANDDCSNATVINCGDTLSGETTAGATGGSSTSCIGTIGDDIWYQFTGDGSQVTLTATATSTESPQIQVYESTDGTCSGFTPGTCFTSAGSGETAPTVTFNTTVGLHYFVQIGSWIYGDPATVYDLSITCATPPTPPANDDCTGATTLTPSVDFASGVQSGTLLGATTTAGLTPSCQSSVNSDVWYSVVVPASGNITIETQQDSSNTLTDTVVVAYSGSCGALTEVGCNDDKVVGSDYMSLLSLTGQTPGSTLYIGVWKYGTTYPTSTVNQFQIAAYDSSLTTNSFNNVDFKAFPNPVKDILNLS